MVKRTIDESKKEGGGVCVCWEKNKMDQNK